MNKIGEKSEVKDIILLNGVLDNNIKGTLITLEKNKRAILAINNRFCEDEIHIDLLSFHYDMDKTQEEIIDNLLNFLKLFKSCSDSFGTESVMEMLVNKKVLMFNGTLHEFNNISTTIGVLNKNTLLKSFNNDLKFYINNILIKYSKINCTVLTEIYKHRKEFKIYDNELDSLCK